MDVRVRRNTDQAIIEMSETTWNALKHEKIQTENNNGGLKYTVLDSELAKKEPVMPVDQDKNLVQQYEELFGKKPHHKLKEETIKALIDERMKSMVNL